MSASKSLKGVRAGARGPRLSSNETQLWRSTRRHSSRPRPHSFLASAPSRWSASAGIVLTTAPAVASMALRASASEDPGTRSTATTPSRRPGSSRMGRPAPGPRAQTCAFDRRRATRRKRSSSFSSAAGSRSRHFFCTHQSQKPSVLSAMQKGCTPRKRSSPFRSCTPSHNGVPDTIQRARHARAAHVRASAVLGDDTICISSSTTRCQWI
mmetsp:Transcript_24403/g.73230  ORF Transcript_24403/g.73230 Transcript_24403/m.73230 type:complete len:211 (-) Transcript_24403:754-1386(-)